MKLFRLLVALGAGGGTALYLRLGRGFPWTLAAIVGVSVALLAGVTFQTGDRLRDSFRR